jgi:hypothetical protein
VDVERSLCVDCSPNCASCLSEAVCLACFEGYVLQDNYCIHIFISEPLFLPDERIGFSLPPDVFSFFLASATSPVYPNCNGCLLYNLKTYFSENNILFSFNTSTKVADVLLQAFVFKNAIFRGLRLSNLIKQNQIFLSP